MLCHAPASRVSPTMASIGFKLPHPIQVLQKFPAAFRRRDFSAWLKALQDLSFLPCSFLSPCCQGPGSAAGPTPPLRPLFRPRNPLILQVTSSALSRASYTGCMKVQSPAALGLKLVFLLDRRLPEDPAQMMQERVIFLLSFSPLKFGLV